MSGAIDERTPEQRMRDLKREWSETTDAGRRLEEGMKNGRFTDSSAHWAEMGRLLQERETWIKERL